MADLTTKYVGLSLKNPLVVSSSGLTDSVEKIIELERIGAGAVVLKSLFEEQLKFEAGQYSGYSDYPEAEDYIRSYTKDHSVGNYLDLIEAAKKTTTIPIIASINCTTANEWLDFSKKIQNAGADALEINVFYLPGNKETGPSEYEKVYLQLAEELRERISIPIVFKLGRQFSNLLNIINKLYHRKINGVVLFNRFYEPDIDISQMKLTPAEVFSTPSEIRQTLRWVGMVADAIPEINLAASTGVHDGKAAIKLLLAGATAIQVCSVLYKNGVEYLEPMIGEVKEWMDQNNFERLDDFRGKLDYGSVSDPSVYERTQFMKYFSSHH
jgi:dihydroorotate dehydrogenase (fumarate)